MELKNDKKDYASAEIVVGQQHCGKSTYVKDNIIGPAYENGVPIYIFDVQNEWDAFNHEDAKGVTDMEDFLNLVQGVRDSVILFEEATIFFKHNSSDKIITKMFVGVYHTGNVIVLNFHSFRKVPKYVMDMVQVIHICKTKDTEQVIEKIDDDPEFLAAFKEVKAHKDKYFKKVFDKRQ